MHVLRVTWQWFFYFQISNENLPQIGFLSVSTTFIEYFDSLMYANNCRTIMLYKLCVYFLKKLYQWVVSLLHTHLSLLVFKWDIVNNDIKAKKQRCVMCRLDCWWLWGPSWNKIAKTNVSIISSCLNHALMREKIQLVTELSNFLTNYSVCNAYVILECILCVYVCICLKKLRLTDRLTQYREIAIHDQTLHCKQYSSKLASMN